MCDTYFDFLLAWQPSKEAVGIFQLQMTIAAAAARDSTLKEKKAKHVR